MANKLCQRCFHSYVCEQFNEHRNSTAEYTSCHFYNDHFVDADSVVPVVRCKDCEYYERDECGNPYIWMSDGAHLYTQPDDFCSYGERREKDG